MKPRHTWELTMRRIIVGAIANTAAAMLKNRTLMLGLKHEKGVRPHASQHLLSASAADRPRCDFPAGATLDFMTGDLNRMRTCGATAVCCRSMGECLGSCCPEYVIDLLRLYVICVCCVRCEDG